jgi:RNA polymerase sigma-70 factor (ECF subfamily)
MNMPRRRKQGMSAQALLVEPATVAGDGDTFEDLYRRLFPRVYAYVATLLRDQSAAEEVTAQAFERAYRKRRQYKPGKGSADAWLFGIARNAALDELRRLKRRASLETEPVDVAAEPAEDVAERMLRRETVRAAIATLEPAERDLVALKFSAGLSNAEIAAVIGASETNAGTRLHRVIQKLRKACDA